MKTFHCWIGASKYSKYKGREVLFGVSRSCQAESITQSLLEKVEQSSWHALLHLLSLDYAGFSLWMSKHRDAAAVPQLTSGGRMCTTRTLGLECTGVLLTSGGAGLVTAWLQLRGGLEDCLVFTWAFFTVELISTAIHLSGFWYYCKNTCCMVHSTQNLLIQTCQLGRMTQI